LGKVQIEFLLIYDRVDMVLCGMHTIYSDFLGEKTLLQSGGEFWIQANDFEGNRLSMDPNMNFSVQIPTSLTNIEDASMKLFSSPGNNNNLAGPGNFWFTVGTDGWTNVPVDSENNYEIIYNEFGWIKLGIFNVVVPYIHL
jgi:hypothetical protein